MQRRRSAGSRASRASRRHRAADIPASGQPAFRQTRRRTSARRNTGKRTQAIAAELDAVGGAGSRDVLLQLDQPAAPSPARSRRPAFPAGRWPRPRGGLYVGGQPRQAGRGGSAPACAIRSALLSSSRNACPSASRPSRIACRETWSSGRTSAIGGSRLRSSPAGHARQSPQSRAADDPVEDRLGLVVERMPDGHGRRARAAAISRSQPYRASRASASKCPARSGRQWPRSKGSPSSPASSSTNAASARAGSPRAPWSRWATESAQAQLRCEMMEHAKQPHAVAAPRDRDHPGCPRTRSAHHAPHPPADFGSMPAQGRPEVVGAWSARFATFMEAIPPVGLRGKGQEPAGTGGKRSPRFRMIGS